MGYDMQMEEIPATVPDGMILQNPSTPGYHRYTNQAMPVTVLAMQSANVLGLDAPPEFPKLSETEVQRLKELMFFKKSPEEAVDAGIRPPGADELTVVDDYNAKVRLALDAPGHNNNPPGYKFQSNSGWLVTPAECLKIADGIDIKKEMLALHLFPDEGYSAEEGRLWLTCWANFNRLAASHGGYRVL
jgi:hypothetical protein